MLEQYFRPSGGHAWARTPGTTTASGATRSFGTPISPPPPTIPIAAYATGRFEECARSIARQSTPSRIATTFQPRSSWELWAHYIGDISQHGDWCGGDAAHSAYESWAARGTDTFDQEQAFESYVEWDSLVQRTAAKLVLGAVMQRKGDIVSATEMDREYVAEGRDQEFIGLTGAALSLAVNELANVLHLLCLNEVRE